MTQAKHYEIDKYITKKTSTAIIIRPLIFIFCEQNLQYASKFFNRELLEKCIILFFLLKINNNLSKLKL